MSHVVAQLVEAYLGVRPRIGLAGHEANHEALLLGRIDLYVEYTGTALRRMLGLPPVPPDQVYRTVRDTAAARWPIRWLPPFGFNNTYAILMRRAHAERLMVRACTDLVRHAPSLVLGAGDAVIRSDPDLRFVPGGVNGLHRAYGLTFQEYRTLPSSYGRTHRALAHSQVDVIVDFSVHPTVHEHDLLELVDDRSFFGAYHAAPVIHCQFLQQHPQARPVIERLAGLVDNRTMARLNFEVEVRQRPTAEVAAAWLRESGLLGKPGGGDQASAPQ